MLTIKIKSRFDSTLQTLKFSFDRIDRIDHFDYFLYSRKKIKNNALLCSPFFR